MLDLDGRAATGQTTLIGGPGPALVLGIAICGRAPVSADNDSHPGERGGKPGRTESPGGIDTFELTQRAN